MRQVSGEPPLDPLAPEVLLLAYSEGIFPMGDEDCDDVVWLRPDPRSSIPLVKFHVSRRLERTLRSNRFDVTYNQDFPGVIRGCAEDRPVWITKRIQEAYTRLHREGHAHSVEVWSGQRLVGGLYGVQLGAAFMAESKFHRETDASKIALAKLVERLRDRQFEILEVQYLTDHLEQFGAIEIPLAEYISMLRPAAERARHFGDEDEPEAR